MAFEYGVVLASLMGAAAALTGGVVAQRYQHLLETQKEHFAVLRERVLEPWGRAIGARKSNLEGRDPHVVIDYVAADYRFTPGASMTPAGEAPWSESSQLAKESRKHWPRLWAEWDRLNREHEALGKEVIAHLRTLESSFPALPPGKQWANYADRPELARRMAVVSAWASHSQVFERRNYPDWVQNQLTQFGFWHGDDVEAKGAFASQVVQMLHRHADVGVRLEQRAERLAEAYGAFEAQVEDAIHREALGGHCEYCPKFLR